MASGPSCAPHKAYSIRRQRTFMGGKDGGSMARKKGSGERPPAGNRLGDHTGRRFAEDVPFQATA